MLRAAGGPPGGVAWLAGDHGAPGTFEEALAVAGDLRREVVQAGPSLPSKNLSRLYPATMADAVTVVHARLEENKKKAQQSKQKSKSKSGAPHSPSDSHFPGARQGSGDPSAFWMYIEDYFRDFTKDDLRLLLPLLLDPRDDPAYKVPPSGRRVEDEHHQRKQAAAKAAAEAAKAAAVAAASRGDWDAAVVDSKPFIDASPDTERRSSRLVSRHCKEEEQRRQQELEAQAVAAAAAAEQAEAAAMAAAARAMVAPVTASGAPAQQLLDVLPEQRLVLLLQQLTELQQLLGLEPFAAEDPAVQAALAKLQAGPHASNGGTAAAAIGALDAEARQQLTVWLRQQLAALSDRIGCTQRVLPPWAGQPAPPQGAAAAAVKQEGGQQEQGAAGASNNAAAPAAAAAAPLAEQPGAKLATAAYLHPYTELMLRHPVQQHTVQQAVEVAVDAVAGAARQATMGREESAAVLGGSAPGEAEGGEGGAGAAAAAAGDAATPAASLLTATPGSTGMLREVPSVANLSALSEQQTTAGAAADTAATGGQLDTPAVDGAAAAAGVEATPADGAAAAAGADGQQLQAAAGGPGSGGAPSARTGARARGVSNYALLAGKKSSNRPTGPPKKVVRTTTVKQEADAAAAHPVARAVQALVAAGEPDGPAAEQWHNCVEACPELLAAAPEDEVLAELLALQNELMQTSAANRARLAPVLAGVAGELEGARAAAEQRAQEEEAVKAWQMKMREIKRQQHRQRREQAHQEALAAKKQSIMASPRPVLGRQRSSYPAELDAAAAGGAGRDEHREGSPPLEYALRPDELYDVLAQREADQEAFCAVCGDGHSEAPNQIVFCERCDVAVHQQCYGIAAVPDGEWLCEPCREYEETMRAQGVPPAEIRPPTWQAERKPLEGGARSVKCALCPIKCGAFKRAEDGHRWVHSACALWMPETSMSFREVPGLGRQEFVAGLDKVKPERLDGRCAICGLSEGAIMACQQPGGCNTAFHVLCARNIGLYLTIRPDPARKAAMQFRIYCALHSAAQQQRDEKAWQERMEKAAQQQQKESKVKQAERLAVAKQQLQYQEGERYLMHMLRANLETCRMLIDVTKRRERLKKQLVVIQQQQWPLLLQDPEAGLQVVQEQQRQAAEQQAATEQEQQQLAAEQEQQQQQQAAAAVAAAMGVDVVQLPPPTAQQQQALVLPNFSLPPPAQQVPLQPPPHQQQQQQQQFVPKLAPQAPATGQQADQQAHSHLLPISLSMASLPLPTSSGSLPPGLLPPHPSMAPPAFALDMFDQQQQQFAPHQFFMQQQRRTQAAQQQQQQQQQTAASSAAAAAMAAASFPGMPLPLPLPGQQQQRQPELPATAAGMVVNVAGGAAAAAQVPAEVAAMMFSAPQTSQPQPQHLMVPMHPQQQQQQQQQQQAFPQVDPAVAAALQAAPTAMPLAGLPAGIMAAAGGSGADTPRHLQVSTGSLGAAAAAAAAAAGTPRGMSPAAGGSGRPKRAAASAQAGSNKRRRAGSEEAAAAAAAAVPASLLAQQQPLAPPPPPAAHLAADTGGAAAAAGRRQRTASAKVRENLLQRERQMTAEEAEALNARLPGSLRYFPAAELEATLGSGSGSSTPGGSRRAASQRQARPRGKPPGSR